MSGESKRGFSMADIQAGMKSLNHTEEAERKPQVEDKETTHELASLREIYTQHSGNIERIFRDLNCNPRKALKHPPRDEMDFADKFYHGFYTDISSEVDETAYSEVKSEGSSSISAETSNHK